MFKIGICEDDKKEQSYIKSLIRKFFGLDIKEVATFDSGEALVYAYKKEKRYSILILDVQMDKLNGIEAAKIIRKYDQDVIIIIITSILEYAIDGYSINAFDFILKPINEEKFKQVLKKAIKKLRENEKKIYSIQKRDKTLLVKLSEIVFIESDKKKVKIHCKDD